VISLLQTTLPDITQHSQDADIHVPGRIPTHNLSKQAATDPHITPYHHWNWPFWHLLDSKYSSELFQTFSFTAAL